MKTLPLVVEHLSFTFAGRAAPTLRDISYSIEPGSWTVLAGRSGSGKSTLLRAMAGLIPHHSAGQMQGDVLMFGRNTRSSSPAELASQAGLLLQLPDDQICTTTVGAEIAFGLENLALPSEEIASRVRESLAGLGLRGRERQGTQQLSGGEKQRLALAAVLAMRPRLLLLDEPLSQLDAVAAAELLAELARLRDAGMAIVLAEHRLDEVLPYADRALVIDEGRLSADVAANQPARLCECLGAAGLAKPELAQLAEATGLPAVFDVDGFLREFGDRRPRPPAVGRTSGPSLGGGKIAATDRETDRRPYQGADAPRSPGAPVVIMRAEGLAFRFPRGKEAVFENLNFQLHAGERVAVVGANGSGKSTLLAMLAGLLRPTEGELAFAPDDGSSLQCFSAQCFLPQCGLMLQNPDLTLFCNTVREELAFGPRQAEAGEQFAAERVAAVATQLELTSLLDEPPLALSQGQRLRTAVGALLTLEPRLLLLDEPTTGQDQPHVTRLLAALAESVDPALHDKVAPALRDGDGGRSPAATESPPRSVGATARVGATQCLTFSTHDLRSVVRYADRTLVLADGRLLADCTPEELLDDDALLAAARLRRPPLFEVRRRLGLAGRTVAEMAEELRR
ncbi:MAG TPA: ABC transporter ATP-binding protein [Pirellulales bacterium]|nr:ABC transporter ATP-binding protein [Pirellulales bacterium]